jgi:hypothetical protein
VCTVVQAASANSREAPTTVWRFTTMTYNVLSDALVRMLDLQLLLTMTLAIFLW